MKYYTGVGSRETPDEELRLMRAAARKLNTEGWTLRSGAAPGADVAFQQGAVDRFLEEGFVETKHPPIVYLPWESFESKTQQNLPAQYVDAGRHSLWQKARNIVSDVHPAWDKCSGGAKALHTRNVFQVLGDDLDTPSSFCILWAEPSGESCVKGGTNTAYQLCLRYNIPVFNLYFPECRLRLFNYTYNT